MRAERAIIGLLILSVVGVITGFYGVTVLCGIASLVVYGLSREG